MDLQLAGRLALVGGSSRGLGKAIALALAAEGCNLIIYSRSADKLEKTAAAIRTAGVQATTHCINLSISADVDALVAIINSEKPDILVNVPGGPPPATALGIDKQLWRQQAEVLLFASITITEAAVTHMQAQSWGRVLTVTSSGVQEPIAQLAMSNTLRAGFTSWSKTLASLVAGDGITINTLVPGRIDTERVAELNAVQAKSAQKSLQQVRIQSEQMIPARRYGTPSEFAATAAFLCSQKAAYITGSQIRVDGGSIASV